MRVIVCGMHRTGTTSMQAALWQLGFHDCYHMINALLNAPVDPQMWIRALEHKYAGRGSFDLNDWDLLLGDCQAASDLPATLFGPELAEAYPDAKVVVLYRDPEKWYESVLHSVHVPRSLAMTLELTYLYFFDADIRNFRKMQKAIVKYGLGFDHATEKEKAIDWYEKQYRDWRSQIPAERRLEYRVQDGWKPLCDFLDVPVPKVKDPETGKMIEMPFPRKNDRNTFQDRRLFVRKVALARANRNFLALIGAISLAGAATYMGYLQWSTRLG